MLLLIIRRTSSALLRRRGSLWRGVSSDLRETWPANTLSGIIDARLSALTPVLRSDLLNCHAHGDAPLGFHLLPIRIPVRRIAIKLPIPIEHDVHSLGLR